MNTSKKFLSLLLTASLLTAVTASCGSDSSAGQDIPGKDSSSGSAASAETAAPEVPSAYEYLPEKDYGGLTFTITSAAEGTRYLPGQIMTTEETGDIIMDSALARNRRVEEKFNVHLNYIPLPAGDYYNTLRASIQANDQEYDLACGFLNKMGGLAAEPLFLNVSDLPLLDLSRPWYPKSNEGLNVAGRQSIIFSDYTCITLSCTYGIFFNETLGKSFQIPDLQQMVLDGKWTIERLLEYTDNVTSDLNGDGKLDLNDRWGHAQFMNLLSPASDTPLAFQYGMGSFTTTMDKDGLPVLSLNTERELKIVDLLHQLFRENNRSYLGSESREQAIMFANGQSLFLTAIIMHAGNYMRDMKDQYQVLPMPKLDESQEEYYTTISYGSSYLHAIPVSVRDPEMSSVIFDALSYEGSQTVIPAFFEQSMKVKYSRNDIMPKIFDIVRDSVRVDFGLVYDGGIGMNTLISKLISTDSTDFASQYAKLEPRAVKKYDEVLSAIAAAE